MKAFFVVCFAVAALAESDPNLVYTTGIQTGLPLMSSFYGSPLISALNPVQYLAQPTLKIVKEEEKPEVLVKKVEEGSEQVIPTTQYINQIQYLNPFQAIARSEYIAKNGEVEHRVIQKRDAESDPWTVYNAGLYSGIYPSIYSGVRSVVPSVAGVVPSVAGVVPSVYSNKATFINPFTGDVTGKVTNDAITSANYAGKGTYYRRAPGSPTVHIAKRDAEADPLTIISNPLMYRNPFYSSFYSNPLVNPVVYRTPVVQRTVAVPNGVEGVVAGKTVANDAAQWTPNYAGKGMYRAATPGTEHVAKREAEADPLLVRSLYNTYPAVASTYYNPTVVRSSLYNYNYRPIVRSVVNPVVYY